MSRQAARPTERPITLISEYSLFFERFLLAIFRFVANMTLGGLMVVFSLMMNLNGITVRISFRKKQPLTQDRKSTRLNSSHQIISYAVFCLKKKKNKKKKKIRT